MSALENKVVIITGASSGIGEAFAERFAETGAKVVLAARSTDKLDALAQKIIDAGHEALAVATDVTDEDQVVQLFKKTMDAHGKVDILINNAGMTTSTPTVDLSVEDWRRVVDVNLTGPFICAREAFRIMKEQKRGRILNIGSVSARMPRLHNAPYSATKFGLDGLTHSLALDGREHGIAASILHPGNIHTAIWTGREDIAAQEGTVQLDDMANVAITMCSLPDDVNMLEGLILPVSMPFLGRG